MSKPEFPLPLREHELKRVKTHRPLIVWRLDDAAALSFAIGLTFWVQEAWAAHWMYNNLPAEQCGYRYDDNCWYRVEGKDQVGSHGCPGGQMVGAWRVPETMPKRHARYQATLVALTHLRIDELDYKDMLANGFPEGPEDCGPCTFNVCETHIPPYEAFHASLGLTPHLHQPPSLPLLRLTLSVDNL